MTIIPKCTGSTPNDMPMGVSVGRKTIIAGRGSRKQPTSSSRMLMASRTIRGFSLIPAMAAAISRLMRLSAMIQPRGPAAASRKRMAAALRAAVTVAW